MSLHRSLKTKPGALNQHRNVLRRSERIAFLSERGAFDPLAASPLGLIKVGNRKAHAKKKADKAEETAGAEGAAPAAAAAPAAPAAKAPAKPGGKVGSK
jgi:small basic protein (TIGR04137 family)